VARPASPLEHGARREEVPVHPPLALRAPTDEEAAGLRALANGRPAGIACLPMAA